MASGDFRNIDYKKLKQEFAQYRGFDPTPILKKDPKVFTALIGLTVIPLLLALFTSLNAMIVVALGGFIFFALRYIQLYNKAKKKLKHSIPATTGLKYSSLIITQTYKKDGVIYGIGHSHKIKELLQGWLGEKRANYFIYSYTTGHGREKHENTLRVFTVYLREGLPYILLDNTKNNLGFLSNLPVWPGEDLRMSLEGNFNKHFKLYSATPDSSDPLRVITPDVMQELIDHKDNFDIEISNGRLTIFSSREGDFLPMLKRMVHVAEKVVASLEENIKHYSAPISQRTLHATNKPIKRSWKQKAFYAAIVVPAGSLIIAPLISESFATSDYMMPLLFIVGGVTAVVLLIKHSKR